MTSTDTQLTNGSYPITIGNRLLQASVLSDRDYSTIDEFIQSKVIEVARRAASDLAPTERTELHKLLLKLRLLLVGEQWKVLKFFLQEKEQLIYDG